MTTDQTIDWRAIILGTVAAAAMMIALFAFGLGAALSIPATDDQGTPPFSIVALALWMLPAGVASSALGGYLAGRLRKRAGSATEHEIEVHDRAHGLGVWALGVVAALLFLVVVAGPPGRGAAMNGPGGERLNFMLDSLFRQLPSTPGEAPGASSTGSAMAVQSGTQLLVPSITQAEREDVGRILRFGRTRGELSAENRAHIANLVAMATDRTQGEALRRVDQVLAEAKRKAEMGRRAAALAAALLSAAALLTAVAAIWAAKLGGRHRN